MARAIRFLAEHYLDQPQLEDAAAAAGLSPFHFQRLFTRYAGVSPKAFVGHLTLEHAKTGLAEGASVLDAALDAGLSGPSRLHDLCLKIEAMTPGDYARGGAGLDDRLRLSRLPVRPGAGDGDAARRLRARLRRRRRRGCHARRHARPLAEGALCRESGDGRKPSRRAFSRRSRDRNRSACIFWARPGRSRCGRRCWRFRRQGHDLSRHRRAGCPRQARRARSAPRSAAIRSRC